MSAVGTDLAPRRIPSVSADAMRTMAVLLNDPNAIHLDPDAVRAVGLGDRVINQGPTNCGYVLDMVLANFEGGTIVDFGMRFLGNVRGGDEVVAGGTVTEDVPLATGRRLTCAVWLEVVGTGRALEGTASIEVP